MSDWNTEKEVYDLRFKQNEDELDDHENRIRKLEEISAEAEKNTAVMMERLAKNLESLNITQKDIKETLKQQTKINEEFQKFMTTMDNKIPTIEANVSSIKCQTEKIDEEGKVNIRKWIKDNWFPLILAIGGIIAFATGIIK